MSLVKPSNKWLYQHGLLSVLILLGISMGLWQETMGPTLPLLSAKLNVSYESMGYIMSFRSCGSILGLLMAAIVYDTFPFLVHYLMSAECFLAGVITIIIPWCTHYWMILVCFLIQSSSQQALNNGGQFTILRTFKERSIGKMQLYHLGYGIGGVLSGIISQQFISNSPSRAVRLTKYCMKQRAMSTQITTTSSSNTSMLITSAGRRFEYIYLIAGVVAMCSATIFLLYKFIRDPDNDVHHTKKKESWFRKLNPKYIAVGNFYFGTIMSILLFLYYFFYIFGLITFTPYIVVYAIDPCKAYTMSLKEATYLHTALNAFFLLGRVLGSFLLDRNPALSLLLVNTLNICFNIVLVTLSNKYSLALWIGACGMRLCNSVLYPSGTSFVNRYIIVSSSLISMAFIGNTLGSFTGSALGGYLVDNYPSNYITYGCMSGMLMLYFTVIAMVILGTRNGLRDFSEENKPREMNKVEEK